MATAMRPDPGDPDAMHQAFGDLMDPAPAYITKAERRLWRVIAGVLIGVLIVLWLAFILATWPAAAQEIRPMPGPGQVPCAKADDVIGQLKAEYGEHLTFVGVTADGLLMELYSSNEGQTWTIVTIHGKGFACIVLAGDGFEVEPIGTATAFNKIAR